jgi:hypothetical protein
LACGGSGEVSSQESYSQIETSGNISRGVGNNNMKKPSNKDLLEIRAFIGSVEWRFAKTMPLWPHFYNCLEWNKTETPGFLKLVSAIFNHGYQEEWPTPSEMTRSKTPTAKRMVTYFNIDGYKYWVMDPTIETTSLINRAKLSAVRSSK